MKKILVITRLVPIPLSGGSSEYFYEIVKYLIRRNFQVEILVAESIDKTISNISQIYPDINRSCIFPFKIINIKNRYFRIENIYDIIILPVIFIYSNINTQLKYIVENFFIKIIKIIKKNKLNESWVDSISSKFTDKQKNNILKIIEERKPDIIVANYVFTAEIFKHIIMHNYNPLKAIIAHDVFKNRYYSFKKKGVETKINEAMIKKEKELLNMADLVIAINDEEKKEVVKIAPQSEVVTVQISKKIKTSNIAKIDGRCLFVGSNADHNIHGINWFLANVWPYVIEQKSNASLHICGNVCRSIKKRHCGLKLLGKIDDLSIEYAQANVFIEPNIAGSGTKTKIIDALSYGVPIVTTYEGIKGLEKAFEKSILIGENEIDFANKVVKILLHKHLREKMIAAARSFTENELNEDVVFHELINIIG